MSLSIGPNSLLLLPAGFNPVTAFRSYTNLGLTHVLGTPLVILPGQGFAGAGTITDFVNCQGTISAENGSIDLSGGFAISGSGNLNLGEGWCAAWTTRVSGITGGSLSADSVGVGNFGNGTLTQSGGSSILSYGLLLGCHPGYSGTYNLSGSAVLSANSEFVGFSGTGTLNQTGGSNSVSYLTISSLGRYQFSGGTLQVASPGLVNQGVFDATGSTGVLNVAGSAIVDLSQAALVNTGSMSVCIGPNSLLLLPAGFNPATAFSSYSNMGLTNNLGTTLTVLPGQGFAGGGSLPDFVDCRGTILATNNNVGVAINLNAGIFVSGTGSVNLGGGTLTVNNALSGISGGSLSAGMEYVGNTGNGTFTQSGGTNSVNLPLYLAYGAGSSANYSLSGSGVLAAGVEYVGFLGAGVFMHSGGTNSGSSLFIGYYAGSNGTYALSGSGVLTASAEYVGYYGTGALIQTGGSNSVTDLTIGSLGRYQFGGGTLQVTGGGLANQGVFDATGSLGLLTASGNAIVDLSQATLVNTGSMSLSIGPNSLLLLPAGFNPATAFGSYSNQGLAHNVGTPLTVLPGQGFAGNGSIADFVNCQGTISGDYGSINLNGGVAVSGTGSVFGIATFNANNTLSGITGGNLIVFSGYLGYSGTGIFTQSGGAANITNLYLGYSNSSSSGNYNLSGPGVLNASNEFVGCPGIGTFAQTGGLNSASYLNIGSLGRYQFSGGTLQINCLSNQGVFDAAGGAGLLTASGSEVVDFSQAAPINAGNMSLSIGPNSLLLLPAGFNPATAFGSYSNQGTTHYGGSPLTISAGQAFSGGFTLTDLLNCQGALTAINGGSIYLNGGVSIAGMGIVNLGGGVFSVDNLLSQITGGSLAATSGYIGCSGTGSFSQSGGTNNVNNSPFSGGLYLGYNPGSNGTYNLSGSAVLSTYAEYVGYSGNGTLNHTDATNSTSYFSALYLGYNPGSCGVYNLSGAGSLSTYNEYVGNSGAGTFTQSGGTNNVSSLGALYIGNNTGSNGSYNLSGSGSLAAFTEYVGCSGGGTFTQSGGTNTVPGLLQLGASGTYNLNGGVLLASNIQGSGTFNLGGGTLVANAGFSSSQAMALTGSGGNGNINTGGNQVTLSGGLSGPGGLTVSGGGTLALSGSNTYQGGTMIDGGVLQLGNSAALGSGGLIVVVGTLNLAGYSPSIAVLSGAAGAITNSSTSESTLSVVPLSTTTFGGAIDDGPTGKVTLVLEGSGTLVLCGTDTYTGGTFVDAGTLVLTQATALPAGESLTVGAGGTFVFDPSVAAAPVETARGAAAAVPEPGTLALLSMAGVVAAAALWWRRTRRYAAFAPAIDARVFTPVGRWLRRRGLRRNRVSSMLCDCKTCRFETAHRSLLAPDLEAIRNASATCPLSLRERVRMRTIFQAAPPHTSPPAPLPEGEGRLSGQPLRARIGPLECGGLPPLSLTASH